MDRPQSFPDGISAQNAARLEDLARDFRDARAEQREDAAETRRVLEELRDKVGEVVPRTERIDEELSEVRETIYGKGNERGLQREHDRHGTVLAVLLWVVGALATLTIAKAFDWAVDKLTRHDSRTDK